MEWTRKTGRVARDRRRPDLESLEIRQLLSLATALSAGGPDVNADGSTNFDGIIGASAARSQFHLDGSGHSVAVIDTGVNYNNAALGGGIGPGHKVVAGVDFSGSPNGVLPTWQHGTGVAGLVASSDPAHPGVAPGADIVALRVFGDNNQGSFGEIADALDWVVQHHGEYNITAVNLSLSDSGNYLSNPFGLDGGVGQRITADVAALEQLNIPVISAAGNSFDGKTQGLGFPAIIPDVISVTGTDAHDQLAANAQRLGSAKGGTSAVSVAAPSIGITAPAEGNSFTTEDGTSFAAPLVTGSVVLLQQMYENAYHTLPTIAVLDQLLQQGAVTVHDGTTGIDVGRLDVLKSLQILDAQIAASQAGDGGGSGGTGTSPTSPGDPPTPAPAPAPAPTPAPPAAPPAPPAAPTPLTQVIVNGVSLGNYSTAALAAKYPSLFSFLKGPVTTLRVWTRDPSTLHLGPSTPSAAHPARHAAQKTIKHPSNATKNGVYVDPTGKMTHVVHRASTPKPHHKSAASTILSYLFPFKF